MIYTCADLPAILPRIDAAWQLYAADPRAYPPEGSRPDYVPDDYGAFCGAVAEAFELNVDIDRFFLDRAYRHYNNEKFYNNQPPDAAFAAGLRIAFEQLC